MASVIIVESGLKDSVREYGLIVDAANENNEFSGKLASFISEENDDISNKQELIKIIYESSSTSLSKLSEKEFEPTFNLIVYLISQLNGESYESIFNKDSVLLQNLMASTPKETPSFRDRKAIKYTTILSVLNNVFNFLPETSSARIHVLDLILTVIKASNLEFNLFAKSIGDNLLLWLTKANASESQVSEFFWKFISLDDSYSYSSLQLIKKFSQHFQLSLAELHQLIKFALLSEVPDVSFLVTNNVAAALKANANDELVSLFSKYINGEVISSVPSSFEHADAEAIQKKSKSLSLTKFFIENDNNNKNIFKYSEIPSSLVSSQSEFEELLISSIKAGLIEGKLNQIDETFYLTKAHRFIVAGEQQELQQGWENVRKVLVDWRLALENLHDIVNNSREEIVNNNNNTNDEENAYYHEVEEEIEEQE